MLRSKAAELGTDLFAEIKKKRTSFDPEEEESEKEEWGEKSVYDIDLDAGMDKKVLHKHGLLMPTEIPGIMEGEAEYDRYIRWAEEIHKDMIREIKGLKTQISNLSEEKLREGWNKATTSATQSKYSKLLKDPGGTEIKRDLLAKEHDEKADEANALGYYMDRLPERIRTASETVQKTGKGMQQKRNSYKDDKDGHYGVLQIDLPKLVGHHKLIAKQGEAVVLDLKVDDDFIDLIRNRYNNKKTYSKLSQNAFKELTKLSGLPIHKGSSKFKKILGGCVEYYNSPKDLMDDLELVRGSINSGNNSPQLINKGISIIDELLKIGKISPKEHEQLFSKYLD